MIETVAKENDVQLIVMTPGHHSKVAQFLIGSTCERVAKHAEMSVLIMRAEQPTSLRNIVFGIDGSKAALTAMLEAVETFGLVERNVKAILVNVVSVTPIVTYVSPPGFVARVEDNLIMSGEASLAEAEKMICDAGVKNVSVKLKNGSPESELLKVVEEMQAEMIVLGSQKRSTLEQVFIGSVASKVVAHAPCSVAVFKNLAALPV
jgi:nucleotide-binding universal stress UspA family protein